MGNQCTTDNRTSNKPNAALQLKSSLILKVSTWQRDSHELFDYESTALSRKNFLLESSCGITRSDQDYIEEIPESEYFRTNRRLLQDGDDHLNTQVEQEELIQPMIHIHQCKGGFYSIFDQPHFVEQSMNPHSNNINAPPTIRTIVVNQTRVMPMSLQTALQNEENMHFVSKNAQQMGQNKDVVGLLSASNFQKKQKSKLGVAKPIIVPASSQKEKEENFENKLWMIVRYNRGTSSNDKQIDNQQENCFELRGGEIFKLGRIVFQVTEICSNHIVYKKEEEKKPEKKDLLHQAILDPSFKIQDWISYDGYFNLNRKSKVQTESEQDELNFNQSQVNNSVVSEYATAQHKPFQNPQPCAKMMLYRRPVSKEQVDLMSECESCIDDDFEFKTPIRIREKFEIQDPVVPLRHMDSKGRLTSVQSQYQSASLKQVLIEEKKNASKKKKKKEIFIRAETEDLDPTVDVISSFTDDDQPFSDAVEEMSNDPSIVELQQKLQDLSHADDVQSNYSVQTQRVCRFCFDNQQTQLNPLISPCGCIGSMSLIHFECLRMWLSRKECVHVSGNQLVTTYTWKSFYCELCLTKYQDYVTNPLLTSQKLNIVDIKRPKSEYVILQSKIPDPISKKDMKAIHIIDFDAIRKSQLRDFIRMGRSVQTDLRVNDISVSRVHAHLKMDSQTKQVYLVDNESKFGTLVQIQRPMFLKENKAYYLQHGRSIIKAQIQGQQAHFWDNIFSKSDKTDLIQQRSQLDPNKSQSNDQFQESVGKFFNKSEQNEIYLTSYLEM